MDFENNDPDFTGIELEELFPIVKNNSSGISSTSQLVDGTSNVKIVSDTSDYS